MCQGLSAEENISGCSCKEEDSYPELFIFWSVMETEPSKSLIPAALALRVGVDDSKGWLSNYLLFPFDSLVQGPIKSSLLSPAFITPSCIN